VGVVLILRVPLEVYACPPRVDLVTERVDGLAIGGADAVDGQAELALPALNGAHTATQIGRYFFPAVEGERVGGAIGLGHRRSEASWQGEGGA
jgi:hypothetical protein